jgi:hypothetical protein
MAQAETDPTRSDDAASKASSNWLLLEEVFQRWRVRLESSQEAVGELYALLCDRETRSAIRKVDASGKEISGTARFVDDPGFWPDRLLLVPDADGGVDHLAVDYPDSIYLPDGHWEGFVRRLDVERHERQFPELAATPPAPTEEPTPRKKYKRTTTTALPPAPETAPDKQQHEQFVQPELPSSAKSPVAPSEKTKPITPAEEPGETYSAQLVSLMQKMGLAKSGLRLAEARIKAKHKFTKEYPGRALPEDVTFNRAYKKYKNVKDASAETPTTPSGSACQGRGQGDGARPDHRRKRRRRRPMTAIPRRRQLPNRR